MKPRQHEQARRARTRGLVIDEQHAQRRLAPRLDAQIQLAGQLTLEVFARADRHPAQGRARQGLARARRPVKLAPEKRAAQPRRGPGAHVEKPIPRTRDAFRSDRAITLDHEHRVVVEPDTFPARVAGQQHEIRATQLQSAHVSLQRGHVNSSSDRLQFRGLPQPAGRFLSLLASHPGAPAPECCGSHCRSATACSAHDRSTYRAGL